jgi:hypothetical protein
MSENIQQDPRGAAGEGQGQELSCRQTTQADKLRDNLDIILRSIEPLKDSIEFEYWEIMIRKALKEYKLDDLIDSRIARPRPNHPHHERWHEV